MCAFGVAPGGKLRLGQQPAAAAATGTVALWPHIEVQTSCVCTCTSSACRRGSTMRRMKAVTNACLDRSMLLPSHAGMHLTKHLAGSNVAPISISLQSLSSSASGACTCSVSHMPSTDLQSSSADMTLRTLLTRRRAHACSCLQPRRLSPGYRSRQHHHTLESTEQQPRQNPQHSQHLPPALPRLPAQVYDPRGCAGTSCTFPGSLESCHGRSAVVQCSPRDQLDPRSRARLLCSSHLPASERQHSSRGSSSDWREGTQGCSSSVPGWCSGAQACLELAGQPGQLAAVHASAVRASVARGEGLT